MFLQYLSSSAYLSFSSRNSREATYDSATFSAEFALKVLVSILIGDLFAFLF